MLQSWVLVYGEDTFNQGTGRCASLQLLQEMMRFCQKYRIHLISDEIYGLSCWGTTTTPDALPFHSVLAIDKTNLIDPALVHVLWGMSKVRYRSETSEMFAVAKISRTLA